jgi:hypothetical protein
MESETRSDGWSTLKCRGLRLVLHILDQGDEHPIPHAGLNLQVDDLDTAVEEHKAASATIIAVREVGGNVPVRLAEVKDPDGNGFEVNQYLGLH